MVSRSPFDTPQQGPSGGDQTPLPRPRPKPSADSGAFMKALSDLATLGEVVFGSPAAAAERPDDNVIQFPGGRQNMLEGGAGGGTNKLITNPPVRIESEQLKRNLKESVAQGRKDRQQAIADQYKAEATGKPVDPQSLVGKDVSIRPGAKVSPTPEWKKAYFAEKDNISQMLKEGKISQSTHDAIQKDLLRQAEQKGAIPRLQESVTKLSRVRAEKQAEKDFQTLQGRLEKNVVRNQHANEWLAQRGLQQDPALAKQGVSHIEPIPGFKAGPREVTREMAAEKAAQERSGLFQPQIEKYGLIREDFHGGGNWAGNIHTSPITNKSTVYVQKPNDMFGIVHKIPFASRTEALEFVSRFGNKTFSMSRGALKRLRAFQEEKLGPNAYTLD